MLLKFFLQLLNDRGQFALTPFFGFLTKLLLDAAPLLCIAEFKLCTSFSLQL